MEDITVDTKSIKVVDRNFEHDSVHVASFEEINGVVKVEYASALRVEKTLQVEDKGLVE